MHFVTVGGWASRKQKNLIVGSTNCCWHFLRVTQTDREYGLMSSSKIGLVKITCHESLHSSHDVEFLHSYQQSYTSTWDKLLRSQCVVFENIIWLQKYNWEYLYTEKQYIQYPTHSGWFCLDLSKNSLVPRERLELTALWGDTEKAKCWTIWAISPSVIYMKKLNDITMYEKLMNFR